jgi:hypothetical protein
MNDFEMKICFTCKIQKSITLFNNDKYRSDGLTSSCKRCLHINNYKRKAKKLEESDQYILFQKLFIDNNNYSNKELAYIFNCPESEIEYAIKYFGLDDINNKLRCSKCQTWKHRDAFANDSSRKTTGKRNWCNECFNLYRSQPNIKDNIKKTSQQYFENNKEKILSKNKLYYQNHVAEHSARVRFNKLKRKKATPSWANKDKIMEFYLKADQLTQETGIVHEVDHIIPLNGKNVCGLHVEYNLQILTREQNRKKFNSFLNE